MLSDVTHDLCQRRVLYLVSLWGSTKSQMLSPYVRANDATKEKLCESALEREVEFRGPSREDGRP